MAEPEEILTGIRAVVAQLADKGELAGCALCRGRRAAGREFWRDQQVVVTAGPTHENLDPVRFLGNRSSGAMGYALAAAAVSAGARVTLISGPSELLPPRGLADLVSVRSAREMADAVAMALDGGAQWLIMAAAVADFGVDQPADAKLKKDDLGEVWTLQLRRNPTSWARSCPPTGRRS